MRVLYRGSHEPIFTPQHRDTVQFFEMGLTFVVAFEVLAELLVLVVEGVDFLLDF